MTELAPTNGRRLDARFTLLEKLGTGGQGEVWRAHDQTRGIDIALKDVNFSITPTRDAMVLSEIGTEDTDVGMFTLTRTSAH